MNTPPEVSAAYLAATPKQRQLAINLAQGMYMSKAMLAAGYGKEQSRKCDKKVVHHPNVVTLKEWYAQKAIAKHEVTVERVIDEMAEIALFDPALMYDEGGAMLPVHKWPKEARSSFAGFDSQGAPKFVPKTSAADTLAKIKGWFAPERHVHTVNPLVALLEQVAGAAVPVVTKDPDHE